MKSLRGRIQRIETAKNKSKKRKFVIVKTEPDREEQDLAKAKQEHIGEQNIIYIISYIPEPARLPDFLQKQVDKLRSEQEEKRKSKAIESDV